MTRQREGWLDDEYIRVFASDARSRIAKIYLFDEFLPGYQPVASYGLEVLCLGPDSRLYLVPWIPLCEEFKKERYPTMEAFLADLARLHEATAEYEHFGREVHLVNPLVFGGSPDQEPKMIDQKAHIELCCFWNRTYARIKEEKKGTESRHATDG